MRKILLIDKGSSSIQNFKKSLAGRGHHLVHEQNLRDAVACLKGGDIDLIAISDIFLSSGGLVKFKSLAADIPKLVLIKGDDKRQGSCRLEDNSSVTVRESLSFREFKYWMNKLFKAKELEDENRQLKADVHKRDQELNFYAEMTQALSYVVDIKKRLDIILEKTRKITGAAACQLLFNDEPFFQVIPLRASKKINKRAFKKGIGIAGRVLESGAPIIVNAVLKDRRYNERVDSFSNQEITSLVCAPLKIKDRVLGVLRLINKRKGAGFSQADMNVLMSAAYYSAISIERAFLYEKLKNDELTSLFNARHMKQALEMEIERALRYNEAFSLIFMDIDNFKEINDTFGHLVGSRALVEIARILQDNLRKIDVIARYGGDEFVIILPQTQQAGSFMVAERLRKSIEKNIFLSHEGFMIRLTASFGIASFPENAQTKDELLKIADDAMYRGKFSTKNSVFAAT